MGGGRKRVNARRRGDVSRCQLPWSLSRPSCLSVKSGIEAGCKTIQKGIPPPRHLSPSCQTVGRPLFYRRSFLPCTYHSLERCLHRCLVHQSTAPRVIRGARYHHRRLSRPDVSIPSTFKPDTEGKESRVSLQIGASFSGKEGGAFSSSHAFKNLDFSFPPLPLPKQCQKSHSVPLLRGWVSSLSHTFLDWRVFLLLSFWQLVFPASGKGDLGKPGRETKRGGDEDKGPLRTGGGHLRILFQISPQKIPSSGRGWNAS